MKRFILCLGLSVAIACSVCPTALAEQLQVGTWSGTWVVNRGDNNPRERPVTIEVKKTSDPHWRWRSDEQELLDGTFVGAGSGLSTVRAQISDVSLDDASLSFSFRMVDAKVNCRLVLNSDGDYEGDCGAVGAGGFRGRHLLLSPPKESTEP